MASGFSRWAPLAIWLAAPACSPAVPDLQARDGWARATAGNSAAAYLTVTNRGGGSDRLVAVSSEKGKASLHRSKTSGGVARMLPVPESEGLAIPGGGELRLSPGGAHVMLTGLNAPLRQGDRFDLILRFRRSAPQRQAIVVQAAGMSHDEH